MANPIAPPLDAAIAHQANRTVTERWADWYVRITRSWRTDVVEIASGVTIPVFRLIEAGGDAHAFGFYSAVPTSGTWAVGDRISNRAPAAGQPKGWLCTVAGSPGTWLSEGNL